VMCNPRGTTMTATPDQTAPKQSNNMDRNLTVLSQEAIRVMTEQTRQVVQRTFEVAGQGAAAFNRSIIDLAQRNVISSFDLAKKMTEAKNLAEVVELQVAYWQKQLGLTSEAKQSEFPSLGIRVAADVGIHRKESRSRDDAKVGRVVNANLEKQKSTDKKSIALAQPNVHRKGSGGRSAAQRGTIKRTSGKQPSKGKK
jgi:hypothetical protein